MRFEVEFHGPFRVGTGESGPGVDERTVPGGIVPASSLKGVMRAAARQLLVSGDDGRDHPLVNEVFGDPDGNRSSRRPSPWSWTDAEPTGQQPPIARHARIARDPTTGAVDAAAHALAVSEHVWADLSSFEIIRTGFVSETERRAHELLLAASAHCVHALGAQRRRGLGWGTIRRVDAPFGRGEVEELVQLRAGTEAGA